MKDCIITENKYYSGIWDLPENLPKDFQYNENNVIQLTPKKESLPIVNDQFSHEHNAAIGVF